MAEMVGKPSEPFASTPLTSSELERLARHYPWEKRYLRACIFNDGIGLEEAEEALEERGVWYLKEIVDERGTSDVTRLMVEEAKSRMPQIKENLPT